MRLRNVKNKEEILNNSSYLVKNPMDNKGKWNKVFNNSNPIYIEIGMGKGKFIIENAIKYPNINFIGIEKYDSVLVRSLEKIDYLDNLRFIRADAINVDEIFDKEIDIIYLNFSDPWPKERHRHRRLSDEYFLKRYDSLFATKKHIIMKTDNRKLFEYSIIQFTNYGYKIDNISLNLYDDDIIDNIPTEYENKFQSKGLPIYKIEIYK